MERKFGLGRTEVNIGHEPGTACMGRPAVVLAPASSPGSASLHSCLFPLGCSRPAGFVAPRPREKEDVLMKRYGSVFRIRPEMVQEYKKAHDEIWPDMAKAIQDAGIQNYTIFFRKDGTLFSYFECEDAARAFAIIGKAEVNTRWQVAMERYFVKSRAEILGPETEDLEEVFHLG
jgi:L-rhamnose mutarotase